MELLYGCTQVYWDCVCNLSTQEQQAIAKAVNALGDAILRDQESPRLKLVQPARLVLKHNYTPTLSILPISKAAHVLLSYEYDPMNDQTLISLLDVATAQESNAKFFSLAKAIYGPLLLRVE